MGGPRPIMFAQCADPKALEGLAWLMCYLTSGTHVMFYASFGTVLLLLALTAPVALLLGFMGALAARSPVAPLRWIGRAYAAIVRGVPDVVFFLFVPIALDQGIEWLRSRVLCDPSVPVRQGNEFVVCAAAKMPLSTSPEWVHDLYGIALAIACQSSLSIHGTSATANRRRAVPGHSASRMVVAT